MNVHLLKLRAGPEFAAKCGAHVTLKTRDVRQPESFTVWRSEVTCHECIP